MAEHKLVAAEIEQIDQLLHADYVIKHVEEDLEGAYVTFMQSSTNDERLLHVKMADARKYFSSKLLEQVNS